jgi:hypothetical protein
MPHRRWPDRLDDELARRGVPARFRRRLLAELRDHADDLTDGEGKPMTDDQIEARLGRPAELAAQAAEEYRRARFASRHPLIVFGLLPLPATVLTFLATALVLGLAAEALGLALGGGDVDRLPRPVVVALVYGVSWGLQFVPFALAAVLFTRTYLRARVSRRWFVAAAAQVLLVAGLFVSSLHYSDVPGESTWMIGLAWAPVPTGDGWGLTFHNAVGWMQVAQVLVPLAVGVLTVRAARRRDAALAA